MQEAAAATAIAGAAHIERNNAGERVGIAAIGSLERRPLEQAAPGNEPPVRAHDRARAVGRLVRQAGDREQRPGAR